MSNILDQDGTVSITSPKDTWEKDFVAGRTYHFKVDNTGDHGRFRFVLKHMIDVYENDDDGRIEHADDEYSERIVKCTLSPGESETGSFVAKNTDIGLENDRSTVKTTVKWIVTVHKSHYSFRIWDEIPGVTSSTD